MATPGDYLDAADLKQVAAGGLVREDVLDQIFDNSDIPTIFLDAIGTDGAENSYTEWTEDKLADPYLANKVISGSDTLTANNNATVANAKRVGNHCQISIKQVAVTDRTQNIAVIGRADEMGYQTARRLIELRRDVEAISLSGQASVQDNGDTTPGQSAGAAAWIVTHKNTGAGGAVAGFQTGTKLVTAKTPGEGRGITWTMISDLITSCYKGGGDPSVLMSIPEVTKAIGRYLFTTPYAAQPTANVSGSGPGVNQTSQGYIDVFRTDFGTTMKIVPNRLQQGYADAVGGTVQNVADVFGFDYRYWKLGLIYGWKVDPLGKDGLSFRKLLSVDWTLKCLLERANFLIADINPTVAMAA